MQNQLALMDQYPDYKFNPELCGAHFLDGTVLSGNF